MGISIHGHVGTRQDRVAHLDNLNTEGNTGIIRIPGTHTGDLYQKGGGGDTRTT
jgi:hypothetical protein